MVNENKVLIIFCVIFFVYNVLILDFGFFIEYFDSEFVLNEM